MAPPSTWRLFGAVRDTRTQHPITNCVVRAFDLDFFREQLLGETRTGPNGTYEITFTSERFSGPLLTVERSPDVFVNVYDERGTLLGTTRDHVLRDARRDSRVDVAVRVRDDGPHVEYSIVGGAPVDRAAAAKLRREELVQLYAHFRGRAAPIERMELARRAFPLLFERDDDCGMGHGDELRFVLRERLVSGQDLAAYDDLPPGATVHWFYTDKIAVKYTTDLSFPADRVDPTVPPVDAEFVVDGISFGWLRASLAALHPDNTEVAPVYVQKVGLIAEYALSRYLASPFNLRDPRDGAARLEYRVRDQGGYFGQTRAEWSHVEVAPDNDDSQNTGTVPHEMFHQVQFRYNASFTSGTGIERPLLEGGARLAEDCINDTPNRYVSSGRLLFDAPTSSMWNAPATSTTIYAWGLFWKYLAEQHSTAAEVSDEPVIGFDAYRKLLESAATAAAGDPGIGYVYDALRLARAQMPWYGTFDQFSWHDAATAELGSNETTWGNFLVANYLHGSASPVLDRRFDYLEDDHLVPPGPLRLSQLSPLVAIADSLLLGEGDATSRTGTLQPLSSHYYRVTPKQTAPPRLLRVTFTAGVGLVDPLVQILRLGPGRTLGDLHRSDRTTWSKTVNMSGLAEVVVVVAGREAGGNYTLAIDEVGARSDVMVTRWNSKVGTEYEEDPRGYTWTWVSPDVMVDTNEDGVPDGTVFFDVNNKLKVRLRNRGDAVATGIAIEFWYQKATPFLSSSAWTPVQNAAGVTQTVTGETLGPGDERWFVADWAPVDDGTHHRHYCVKARVTIAGDANDDNKIVLSNFGSVEPAATRDVPLFLRYAGDGASERVVVVARGSRWRGATRLSFDTQRETVRGAFRSTSGSRRVLGEPPRVTAGAVRLEPSELVRWDGRTRHDAPRADTFYPVDPRTLPPGVDAASLVTVVHLVNGQPVGGVTYHVVDAPSR